jgi:gamma-glutamyltranspeptidase/glutathione hydrolase
VTFATRSAFTTRPTLDGSFGMAASTHWLGSQSAMAVLERGGNAFDAAVACGLVLQVVEPHLNGPGGDLVGIVAPAGSPSRVLCGQGTAPAGATIEAYRSLGLDLIPGAGPLAATIPGAFDAWMLMLRDYGTWEPADVAEFALHYARTGYPVLPAIARTIGAVQNLFRESWTTSAEHWLTAGAAPKAGTLRTSPVWAQTLSRLIASAAGDTREDRIDAVRREWAEGFVAEAVDRFMRRPARDSSGADHPGVLRASDLAGWRASWEEPVTVKFRDFTVLKPGFWTQGPTLLQALSILAGFDDDELDPGTPGGAHKMLEAMKLAMADREAYYGDASLPVDLLLSDEYATKRREQIGESASRDLRPGRLEGLELRLRAEPTGASTHDTTAMGGGEPTVARTGVTKGDTCHLDIVDRHGNMISVTPSGGWLQSSPYLPELGFALGSRLQMMWLEEGLPSSLAPGKRPRTTLSPTLVERAGRAVLSVGTPGGDQQDQWQLPFLLRVLVGELGLQEAIDAPSLHSTNAPESFWPRERIPAGVIAEESLGGELLAELVVRGHEVTVSDDWTLGRLSAVSRSDTGRLRAAANPRGMQGYAVGR